MRNRKWPIILALAAAWSVTVSAAPATAPATAPTTAPFERADFPALTTPLTNIDGTPFDMMKFKGRVLLLVPVAWDTNRRQLEDLQFYTQRFGDRGFTVVGIITADFAPETRSDKDLAQAIRDRYKVTFPVLATTKTTGADAHPLFKYFASKSDGHESGGEIKGPFTKFVVNRNGELAKRWEPAARINNNPAASAVNDILNTPMR